MKFRNNLKRFFTLDRHHAGGFTLVELIVVIAILAILAGIGVPAYSAYITKANKQADITLVSDLKYAMTLAGYKGTFAEKESGYLILTTEGAFIPGAADGEGVITDRLPIEKDSSLDKALIDSFGSNYANVLKLKYADWSANGLMNGLTPEFAYAIAESSFMNGGRVDDLLPDVEKMTSMASKLVTALTSGASAGLNVTLSGLFSSDGSCAIDEVAKKYGITKGADESWEDWAAKSDANSTAFSNLLVLTAAADTANYGNGATTGTNMVMEFSSYYALAATNEAFSKELDAYLAELDGVTSVDQGKAWFDRLQDSAKSYGYDAASDQNFKDQVAFMGIMNSLNNPSKEQIESISKDLSNANLFTDGVVNGMYNDYLDLVDAMSGMFEPGMDATTVALQAGEVAVLYSNKGFYVAVGDTLPE